MGTNDLKLNDIKPCQCETEVYSRITGYYRPVKHWNLGQQEQFNDRMNYDLEIIDINLQKEKENV